ncbi:reverse transcriptase domain-containing protein [Coleofasciculus chthonoplastes]|uniref:reverse transcriptase domain-containing protein n=1 Tax=Coleofasciculus chthonoplastes TaxID=64178 RepID=UPI0003099C0A|nr:reverse transcriptase domain-containing protein [Coleofasciculus chthonoplastes]
MTNTSQTPEQILTSLCEIDSLNKIYEEKFKYNTTKGIDRINGSQFEKQAQSQIQVIHDKCLSGTYKFSPYLELLKSKGRGKPPRVIAIPTVRDRIVLYILKELLFKVFPECVHRQLANTYIVEIIKVLNNKKHSEVAIFRTDIKNFYGSINREKLICKLEERIPSIKIIKLIQRAIETPAVPQNYRKKDKGKYIEGKGVPQGLSISNILASIYLAELDQEMKEMKEMDSSGYDYFRYVDDIIVFTDNSQVNNAENLLKEKINSLDLKLNEDKTDTATGDKRFEYLGYRFELPKVTVRIATVERFIHSVAAKFSRYIYTRQRKINKYNNDIDKLKNIFMMDLNEKITGAISEKRRYGWVFYFIAVNDISVFYKLDKIIASFFNRLDDFDKVPPPNLKKLSRTFYEAKHNHQGGYIHNYNSYQNVNQKREFLSQLGELDPDKPYSEEDINDIFERVKRRNLSELEEDDAHLS